MISTDDFNLFVSAALSQALDGARKAAEAAGCGVSIRLREMTVSGELVYSGGALLSQQVSDTVPLDPTVIVTEEGPSTQAQTDSDNMTATTANGGDKISGETITTTEDA